MCFCCYRHVRRPLTSAVLDRLDLPEPTAFDPLMCGYDDFLCKFNYSSSHVTVNPTAHVQYYNEEMCSKLFKPRIFLQTSMLYQFKDHSIYYHIDK